jgi:CheY-like chemotaxis protein
MADRPVIIVDDDLDDFELVKLVWNELKYDNKLLHFAYGEDVLNYMKTQKVDPFLIISDINLPGENGFNLRKSILEDKDIKNKGIPFVFWSNTAANPQVIKAYELGAHGYFIKPSNYEAFKQLITEMMAYWSKSITPQ